MRRRRNPEGPLADVVVRLLRQLAYAYGEILNGQEKSKKVRVAESTSHERNEERRKQ